MTPLQLVRVSVWFGAVRWRRRRLKRGSAYRTDEDVELEAGEERLQGHSEVKFDRARDVMQPAVPSIHRTPACSRRVHTVGRRGRPTRNIVTSSLAVSRDTAGVYRVRSHVVDARDYPGERARRRRFITHCIIRRCIDWVIMEIPCSSS